MIEFRSNLDSEATARTKTSHLAIRLRSCINLRMLQNLGLRP